MYGFWSGCGMGTASLKANLLHHLTSMMEAVLFEVFLDLQKAYDALYWDRCIEILALYGVDPKTIRPLQPYWDQLTMVAIAGRYFTLLFKGYRRVTQGDPCPPFSST